MNDSEISERGVQMPMKHYPGATIGIIGSNLSSAILAQEAGKLGYRVGSLVLTPENSVRQFASWQTVAEQYDEMTLRHFAGRVDVVIAETGILTYEDYHLLKEYTDVPLSEDLISITTDRLIEKVYLDSLNLLVSPFSLVTNLEDIKEAVEYIGFPCILKTNNRHLPNSDQMVVLYSENDYPEAEKKTEESTCILESWIPSEKRASLTIVRNERGETLVYPIFEIIQAGDLGGTQVRYPMPLHQMIEQEIKRIGLTVVDSIGLIGSITMEFFITSAGVVYLNEASVGLNETAMFTIGSMSVNHYEAAVRALVGLPLPEVRMRSNAAISLQVTHLNLDNVLTQYMMRTDWGFALFNPIGTDVEDMVGQVIVTGESITNCERQIQITELFNK